MSSRPLFLLLTRPAAAVCPWSRPRQGPDLFLPLILPVRGSGLSLSLISSALNPDLARSLIPSAQSSDLNWISPFPAHFFWFAQKFDPTRPSIWSDQGPDLNRPSIPFARSLDLTAPQIASHFSFPPQALAS